MGGHFVKISDARYYGFMFLEKADKKDVSLNILPKYS